MQSSEKRPNSTLVLATLQQALEEEQRPQGEIRRRRKWRKPTTSARPTRGLSSRWSSATRDRMGGCAGRNPDGSARRRRTGELLRRRLDREPGDAWASTAIVQRRPAQRLEQPCPAWAVVAAVAAKAPPLAELSGSRERQLCSLRASTSCLPVIPSARAIPSPCSTDANPCSTCSGSIDPRASCSATP